MVIAFITLGCPRLRGSTRTTESVTACGGSSGRGFDGQELETFAISRRPEYRQHSPKGGDGLHGFLGRCARRDHDPDGARRGQLADEVGER